MSTIKPPKKVSRRHELREDNVITFYARAWSFFDQNRTLIYGALAGVVLLVLAVFGWGYLQDQKADEAQAKLGAIVSVYEAGDYRQALDGNEGALGLLAVADEYGSTDAGNQAHFYAADALYQLGEYDAALEHFDDYDKGDDFLGASAYAGMAAIYENKEDFSRAADLYLEAADVFENELTSPQYLLNAGRAFEAAGDYTAARDAYAAILTRFPGSNLASGVDFYLARVEAKANS